MNRIIDTESKKRLDPELEELITEVINEHYLTAFCQSIKRSYGILKLKCFKRGIKPPSYSTLRNRIKELKSKTCLPKRPRNNNDHYNWGKQPLDIVEFDHCMLDIIPIDDFKEEPLGRPWLTIAIDCYSGMVYGYYLGRKQRRRWKIDG